MCENPMCSMCKESSMCEGGRVEVIPDKDTSVVLNDKTELIETNLKESISPKKTKSEGDDLYEGKFLSIC